MFEFSRLHISQSYPSSLSSLFSRCVLWKIYAGKLFCCFFFSVILIASNREEYTCREPWRQTLHTPEIYLGWVLDSAWGWNRNDRFIVHGFICFFLCRTFINKDCLSFETPIIIHNLVWAVLGILWSLMRNFIQQVKFYSVFHT